MQSALQIYLLGSFRLIVEGIAISNSSWQKRKAKHLVQILALHKTNELHREELMEMLFHEFDEKTASANLYRVLYAARHAIEPKRDSYSSSDYLVSEGRQIKLTAEKGLWIDAREFEQEALEGLKTNNQGLLESAVEIYRGDLLSDEPFEEWAIDQREHLKTLFHRVLRQLAESSEKSGNTEEAHQWLDKILLHEPYNEATHRAKMRLYYNQDELSLALKQYDKCRDVLLRKLDVEPDEETKNLRKRILSAKEKRT